MKRIFIPFFAAAALLASCSDWTEAEHKDFLPPMNQNRSGISRSANTW